MSDRKPFQGVLNIVRFNRHFFLAAVAILVFLVTVNNYLLPNFKWVYLMGIALLVYAMVVPLLVSYYVYDRADFYSLKWFDGDLSNQQIVNITAGFDETSGLILEKFTNPSLQIFDFFNDRQHTEISIQRARKLYPVIPGTRAVNSTSLPLNSHSVDIVFVIFAAHEIRNKVERVEFLKELKRAVKPSGAIYIVEHLRDLTNFFAYNVGFLHFFSRKTWYSAFKLAKLTVSSKTKFTPFVSIFKLKDDGVTT